MTCGDGSADACDWCKHFDRETWICDVDGAETNPGRCCEEFDCGKCE